jgi:hypothetical protein
MLKKLGGCNGVDLTRLAQFTAPWIAPVNTVMDSELRKCWKFDVFPDFELVKCGKFSIFQDFEFSKMLEI